MPHHATVLEPTQATIQYLHYFINRITGRYFCEIRLGVFFRSCMIHVPYMIINIYWYFVIYVA